MTTKTELVEYLKDKKKLSQEKIDNAWTEKQKEVLESGITKPEEVEAMTMRKVSLYFRKLTSVKDAVQLRVIPLGLSNATDYGAKKQFDEANKKWISDRNRAVLEGYTNEQGTPLWRNTGIQSKKGKPIQWEKELRRNLYCLARRDEDTVWKLSVMSLSGKLLAQPVQIGMVYESSALIGKATKEVWDNSRLIMYSTDSTELANPKKAPQPVKEMIETFANDIIVPFKEIDTRARQDGAMSDFFFVKVNVVQASESMMSVSNRITFADPEDLLFDEEKQLTGWISEDIPLNIVDEAMDVYLLMNSRTYMKKQEDGSEEEELQLNLFGYFADEEYVRNEENTPTVGNEGQTTVVPNVTEEVVEDNVESSSTDWDDD